MQTTLDWNTFLHTMMIWHWSFPSQSIARYISVPSDKSVYVSILYLVVFVFHNFMKFYKEIYCCDFYMIRIA